MAEYVLLDRLERLEHQVADLTHRVYRLEGAPERQPTEPVIAERTYAPAPEPRQESALPSEPAPAVAAATEPAPAGADLAAPRFLMDEPAAPAADWETQLGGNWLNKIGAVVLVVGIALLLGYSFTHMGPAGRDAVGLGGGLAMLGTGVFYERRPRYRTFARGLIGGGWAAIYFTVYAMHAMEAARVIHSPIAGALLLVLAAVGMIAHALRYRSEAVAGVAYFSAFFALAITEVTPFSVVALVPLAASLLYIARRFEWRKLALFGLIATYVVCVSRGDTSAPLWTSQALFVMYWLLFEGFDLLVPSMGTAALNAVGFLSLSVLKWQSANPAHLWAFLAAMAAAYAAIAALRARLRPEAEPMEGGWHVAATAATILAAIAIILRSHDQWFLAALVAEGELLHLLGLRFRAAYLRRLAVPLFAIGLVHLTAAEAGRLPLHAWVPVAVATAAVFYINRALGAEDLFFGYAGAAVMALAGGYLAPAHECGPVWFALAGAAFAVGWWRRLADFRYQGYLMAGLAAIGTLFTSPHPPLAIFIGAVAGYALAACALESSEDRFLEGERSAVLSAGSAAAVVALAAWLQAVLPHAALGPAWAALALLHVAAKPSLGRDALRLESCALAAAAFVCCWIENLSSHDVLGVAIVAIACFYAAQFLIERGDPMRLYYSVLATALTSGLMYYEISGSLLTVAWGAQGLALLGAGFPVRDRMLRLSGLGLLLFCILKLFLYDLSYLDTLPRIFSFLALGLILVGVSWIYTRFRERVQKYL